MFLRKSSGEAGEYSSVAIGDSKRCGSTLVLTDPTVLENLKYMAVGSSLFSQVSFGIKNDGSVVSWNEVSGQVYYYATDDTLPTSKSPTLIPRACSSGVKKIVNCTEYDSNGGLIALKDDGSLVIWGNGGKVPPSELSATDFIDVSMSPMGGCAIFLKTNGTAFIWDIINNQIVKAGSIKYNNFNYNNFISTLNGYNGSVIKVAAGMNIGGNADTGTFLALTGDGRVYSNISRTGFETCFLDQGSVYKDVIYTNGYGLCAKRIDDYVDIFGGCYNTSPTFTTKVHNKRYAFVNPGYQEYAYANKIYGYCIDDGKFYLGLDEWKCDSTEVKGIYTDFFNGYIYAIY